MFAQARLAAFSGAFVLGMMGTSHAATLLETTELVASTQRAADMLPPALAFTVVAAGQYTLTLTDVENPVALGVLQAAITRDQVVVAQVAVDYPEDDAEVLQSASVNFAATPGEYRLHLLGEPAPDEAGGTLRVTVGANGVATLVDRIEVIAADPVPTDGQSVLRTGLQLTEAGHYDLTLTDLSFAPTTTTTQALLLQQTATGSVAVPVVSGAFDAPAPGAYELIVVANATGGDLMGLYGVKIAGGPSATTVYQSVHAAGKTPAASTFALTAGAHALDTVDLEFPSPVSAFETVVAQGDVVLARQSNDTPATFTAAAGPVQLFAVATPNADDGTAALNLQVRKAGQIVHSEIRTIDVSEDPASMTFHDVSSSGAVSAGTYTVTFRDFAFPAALSYAKVAVLQGTSIVRKIELPGSEEVTLQASPVRVLVAARPRVASNALFMVKVVPTAGGQPAIASTHSVGGLGRSVPLTVDTDAVYDLTLADLQFPERLASAALSVTDGETIKGQVFGSGTIQRLQLAPGTYGVHFFGQAAAEQQYGLYALKIADSPPQPTVTLTASPASITSGQTSTLQWSSTNATACTASGAWSGTKATSGSQPTDALNATATFSLACTGSGGSVTASATVTVNPPSSGGGGGGGAWGVLCLLTLSGILGVQRRSRRPARFPSSH